MTTSDAVSRRLGHVSASLRVTTELSCAATGFEGKCLLVEYKATVSDTDDSMTAGAMTL